MTSTLQLITNEEEITAYLADLATEDSPVAKATFWQLENFDVERIAIFSGETRNQDLEELEGQEPTLVVFEGDVLLERDIAVGYWIVRGNLTCRSVYIYADWSLLACFGTCTANYIESDYNGILSAIERAETGFVILSRDEMLEIYTLNPGAIVPVEFDASVVQRMFHAGLAPEGVVSEECKQRIARGESVLRGQESEVLEELARLPVDPAAAIERLSSFSQIGEFRLWTGAMAGATAMHALARVNAPIESLRAWIKKLQAAGVPLDEPGVKKRGGGLGSPLHLAIAEGFESAAFALRDEGASLQGGRLLPMVLGPLERMAKAPSRFRAEETQHAIERAERAFDLAERLGLNVAPQLIAEGRRHIDAITTVSRK